MELWEGRARCLGYVKHLRLIYSGLICGLRMLDCSGCGRALDADRLLSYPIGWHGVALDLLTTINHMKYSVVDLGIHQSFHI